MTATELISQLENKSFLSFMAHIAKVAQPDYQGQHLLIDPEQVSYGQMFCNYLY